VDAGGLAGGVGTPEAARKRRVRGPAVTPGGEGEGFGLIPATHPLSARRRRAETEPQKSQEGASQRGGLGEGAPWTPLGEPMSEAEPTAEAVVEVGSPSPRREPGGCSRGSSRGATARGSGGIAMAKGGSAAGFARASGTLVTAACESAAAALGLLL